MLSHSSGVGNYWEAIAQKPSQAFVETRDFLPLIAEQPLEFTPGARLGYSTGGYVILGLIIEALTGEDLSTFITALGDGRLLSPQMYAIATAGLFDLGRARYGLGFMEETINGHRMVGNTGGHFGITGEVWRYENLDYTFAMLTNGEVDGYWSMNIAVKDILCGPSPASDAWRLGMAMAAAARDDSIAAARALFDARPEGILPRSVFEVEAAKARHRGNPEGAERIVQIAAIVEPPA